MYLIQLFMYLKPQTCTCMVVYFEFTFSRNVEEYFYPTYIMHSTQHLYCFFEFPVDKNSKRMKNPFSLKQLTNLEAKIVILRLSHSKVIYFRVIVSSWYDDVIVAN